MAMAKRGLKKDDGYHDDCPICQTMKKMGIRQKAVDIDGPTYITPVHPKQAEALKAAFKKAKEQGGIVGGPFFAP